MNKSKVQNRSTKDDPILEALPAACCDEKAAVEFMEEQRWGAHPCCPHCGDMNVYQMMDSKEPTKRQANFRWRCRGCKAQYTVRTKTVYEDSRIPLKHWCFAFWRASTSKKGVSALEIHRQTGLCYKSSLFLLHRIRYAMNEGITTPLQGIVEADEVFIGGKARHYHMSRKSEKKRKSVVVGLLERGGRIRPKVVADVTAASLKGFIRQNVDRSARIYTDEWSGYRGLAKEYAAHESVIHSRYEYARGEVHTNSIEGFFGMLRRGLNGIYHAVSHEHLPSYLYEFQFRHDYRRLDDGKRIALAIQNANNKRLTYKQHLANGEKETEATA